MTFMAHGGGFAYFSLHHFASLFGLQKVFYVPVYLRLVLPFSRCMCISASQDFPIRILMLSHSTECDNKLARGFFVTLKWIMSLYWFKQQ